MTPTQHRQPASGTAGPPISPGGERRRRDLLEIRRQHRGLGGLFSTIEGEIWRCANEPTPETVAEAQRLVAELQVQLPAHFEFEEAGGYLAEELARAPRLYAKAANMRSEHAEFNARLDEFGRRVQEADSTGETWSALAAELRSFTDAIRSHELTENRLIRDALMDDLGGSG